MFKEIDLCLESKSENVVLNRTKNVLFGDVEQETTVFNYQSEKRTEGTWVFSLPPKPKPKKTQPPVEKKENVLKMTNKKTIKK